MRKFGQWMKETKLNEQPQEGQPGGTIQATGAPSRLQNIDDPRMRAAIKKQHAVGGDASQNRNILSQAIQGLHYNSKKELRDDLMWVFNHAKWKALPDEPGQEAGQIPPAGIAPGTPPADPGNFGRG